MSSSSFIYGWKYDVFLSFRGSDTRHGFTGHLYKALCDKGINTFIDDEELPRGEEITPSLMKAIEESRISILIFSKNYASSSFCLDELVHILACSKKKGRLVLPVFYDVDPSHVRHQTGSYEEALNSLKEWFNDDNEKLQKWKTALRQAADMSGYHFKHGNENEYDFIGTIVKDVSQKINRTLLHVVDYPVGLESRVLKVISLLDDDSDKVHVVGIHGIGGVGKTTIARAVYNFIADQFEVLCFLDNVRENSVKHGLVHLQETLLSKTVRENNIKLGSVNEGIPIIKHRLHQKKVLLVIDDVDNLDQLQATVGGTNWFGSASRVIITTRDKHLLTCHGVTSTYEVDGLNKEEALKLLSGTAFKIDKVDPCYMNILNRVVTYASGLPLALIVIGSNLFGKSIEEWESSIDQYERNPNKKIQDVLKVSFDSLEEFEKQIFLDIACCFKGYARTYVKEILSSLHDSCPEYGIGVLIDKSLIKIDEDGYVTMHDLIEDMGKEIVRQESPEEPGNRSRLWCHEDIVKFLEEKKGTSRIQIIKLDCFEYPAVEWDRMAFKKMNNLKGLFIDSPTSFTTGPKRLPNSLNTSFATGPKHLPNSLRVLKWSGYHSPSLPIDFHPKKLVQLELFNSLLMSLDLFMSKKMFVNMRVLEFSVSLNITEIPNLCGVPNLQELSFSDCLNLIKIHESVGFLDKLKILKADGCIKLTSFPPIKLTSLEELDLSNCSSLECFPEILGKMENVTSLNIKDTPIKELPSSIQNLTQLQRIKLKNGGIIQLPSSIFGMKELRCFIVKNCYGLLLSKENEGEEQMSSMVIRNPVDFLDLSHSNISDEFLLRGLPLFANVKELHLRGNYFTVLPACIKELQFLKKINLYDCENLRIIIGIPPNLETLCITDCTSLRGLDLTLLPSCTKECRFLRKLFVFGCHGLEKIEGIPLNIEKIDVNFCKSLKVIDFTPPASTRKCHILSTLNFDDCWDLEQIKGIPSNVGKFSAIKCEYLSSECRSMLLNKELHEADGYRLFRLPGTSIPEWFEHCINGSSISFWFRNKFPVISLSCVFYPPLGSKVGLTVIINGKKYFSHDIHFSDICPDLLCIYDHIEEQVYDCVLSENEWNHVVCTNSCGSQQIKQIGIHVLKQGSNMEEDIQFTNPCIKTRKQEKPDFHNLPTLGKKKRRD